MSQQRTVIVKLAADLSSLQKQMREAQKTVKEATRGITDRMDSVGDNFIDTGKRASRFALPVKAALATSVRAAANFESYMSKVETTVSGAGDNLDKLTDIAMHWGGRSQFSANQVASAMSTMGLATLRATDIYAAMPATIDLATSANMGLERATTAMTNVLGVFGKEGRYATYVADTMTQANKLTALSIKDIEGTMLNAGSAINAYGISLQDATKMTILMGDASLTGKKAGTQLRALFDDLATGAVENADAFRNLGISVHDSSGNMLPAMDIINNLRDSFYGMSDAQRIAAFESMELGVQARNALLPMLSASSERLDELTKYLYDTSGAAAHYAAIMRDNLNYQLKVFWNQINVLGIKIGTVLLPILTRMAEIGTTIARALADNLSPTMIEVIAVVGAMIAIFGPMLIITGKTIKKISAAIKAFKAFAAMVVTVKKAMAAYNAVVMFGGTKKIAMTTALKVLNGKFTFLFKSLVAVKKVFAVLKLPIVLVVAAIAGLVLAVRHLWETNEGFRTFILNAWDAIRNKITTAVSAIKGLFSDWDGSIVGLGQVFMDMFRNADPTELMNKFKRLIPTIIAFLAGGLPGLIIKGTQFISNLADGMGKTIPELIEKIAQTVKYMLNKFAEFLPEFLEQGVYYLMEIINGFVKMLPYLIDTAMELIQTVIDKIIKFLPKFLDTGIELLLSLIDGILEVLPDLIDAAMTLMNTIVIQIGKMLPVILQAGIRILMSLVGGILDVLPTLIKTAISLIFTIVRTLNEALPDIVYAGVQILLALINGLWSIKSQLLSAGWDLMVELFSTFIGHIPEMWQAGRDIVQGLMNGVSSMFSAIGETARELGSNLLNGVRSFLGINSPSREMMKLGQSTAQGLANGINQGNAGADAAMNQMSNSIRRIVSQMVSDTDRMFRTMGTNITRTMNTFPNIARTAFNNMNNQVRTGMNTANTHVRNGNNTINNTMRPLQGQMHSHGLNAMRGFNNGLLAGRGQVLNTARATANQVSATIRNALQMNSPSRVLMNIGEYIPKSLSFGIESNADVVGREMEALSKTIKDALTVDEDVRFNVRGSVGQSDLNTIRAENNANSGMVVNINMAEVHIREEADIQRIASELERQLRQTQRSRGYAW